MIHISADTSIIKTNSSFKIFDPTGVSNITASGIRLLADNFLCVSGDFFFTFPETYSAGVVKIIASFLDFPSASLSFKESNVSPTTGGIQLASEIKEICTVDQKFGVCLVFIGGAYSYYIYNYATKATRSGSYIYSEASSISALNIHFGSAIVYDIYAGQNLFDEDEAFRQLKTLTQISSDSDGIGHLAVYRGSNVFKSKNSLDVDNTSWKTTVPNLFIANNINSSDKLVFNFNYNNVEIPYYSEDLELSIRQYLSRQHDVCYYYESNIDKVFLSNLEFSGNAMIYVSNYIGPSITLAVPYENRTDYSVTVAGTSINLNAYGQATVSLSPGESVITATIGEDTVSFSVYNIAEAEDTEQISYLELNSWANYKLANKSIDKNTLENTVAYLKRYLRTTTATVDNITPVLYKSPVVMRNIGTNKYILFDRVTTMFVNNFSENVINLE